MSEELVDFDEAQSVLAAELATELRSAVEALAQRAPLRADLVEALRLTRELNTKLRGPRRPAWYETDDPERRTFFSKSPVSGGVNAVAPATTRRELQLGERRVLELEAVLPRHYEGPPHGVHGGWVAAIFDEILGGAQQFAGTPGVTAILEIRYRRITPVEVPLRFRAWIEQDEGRRIVARATCEARGELTADAKAVFMRVDFDAMEARMRGQAEGEA